MTWVCLSAKDELRLLVDEFTPQFGQSEILAGSGPGYLTMPRIAASLCLPVYGWITSS